MIITRHRFGSAPATAALVVVLAIVTVACSIPLDDGPRAVDLGEEQSRQPQGSTGAGGAEVALYYIRNGHLTTVVREAKDESPMAVLTELTAQSGVSPSSGTVSQIPKGTKIRTADLGGGTLSVDLTDPFDNVVGVGRQQAVAQMVMTATELRGVAEVRVSVNGVATSVTSPVRGDRSIVTACDYLSLLPTDDTLAADEIGIDVARRLSIRRRLLENTCPATG